MRPDEVLQALRDDIERVRVDSRWTFFDGHLPRGPNPDRVAGIEARDVIGRDEAEPTDERYRWDIGVGDNRSRTAFQSTAWLVTFLDLRLAASLEALGETSPTFAVVTPASTLAVRETALSLSALRVEAICAVWDQADRSQQKAARVQLADPRISPPSARSAADQAVRILSRALSRGATNGQATAEELCEVCGIRVRGERCGKRCETCQSWRTRNRGIDRPRSLDTAELAGPLAAAARRRARGEGWGAA